MRQVPEKYFRSRDSTKVKQMSRTDCGGGPGERGTISRDVLLRKLLRRQKAGAENQGGTEPPCAVLACTRTRPAALR